MQNKGKRNKEHVTFEVMLVGNLKVGLNTNAILDNKKCNFQCLTSLKTKIQSMFRILVMILRSIYFTWIYELFNESIHGRNVGAVSSYKHMSSGLLFISKREFTGWANICCCCCFCSCWGWDNSTGRLWICLYFLTGFFFLIALASCCCCCDWWSWWIYCGMLFRTNCCDRLEIVGHVAARTVAGCLASRLAAEGESDWNEYTDESGEGTKDDWTDTIDDGGDVDLMLSICSSIIHSLALKLKKKTKLTKYF